MIVAIPTLLLEENYRELRGGKRRFVLIQQVRYKLDHDTGMRVVFRDGSGKIWMTIDREWIIIEEGYAWNGASPKWWVICRWVGTPDPHASRPGTLLHDILRQFDHTEHSYSSQKIDTAFWDAMHLSKFCLKDEYHGAVLALGGLYKRATGGSRDCTSEIVHIYIP